MEINNSIKTSTCGLDCGARCILKVHIAGEVVQKIITGDQSEPGLKAYPRGLAQREVLYAKDRLKSPMKRVGERGSGKFEPISWGEAIDLIASELQ